MPFMPFNENADLETFLLNRCIEMREHLNSLGGRDEGYAVTLTTDNNKYGIEVTHIGAYNETNVYKGNIVTRNTPNHGKQIGLKFKNGTGVNLTGNKHDELLDAFDRVRDMVLNDLEKSTPQRLNTVFIPGAQGPVRI